MVPLPSSSVPLSDPRIWRPPDGLSFSCSSVLFKKVLGHHTVNFSCVYITLSPLPPEFAFKPYF